MDNILYDLIDWAAVEEIVYSECSRVQDILGPHKTEKGILIHTFIPNAKSVSLLIDKTKTAKEMTKIDEAGFFSILVNRKNIFKYELIVEYDNGFIATIKDPYSFGTLYTDEDINRFNAGIHYEIYKKMGAHKTTLSGVDGVYFSVYAPAAIRVSVVGNFNGWDGRLHQMRKLGSCGIYDIFIPNLSDGEVYKFEIKTLKGEPMLKSDPYANFSELRPANASIVYDIENFAWTDTDWQKDSSKKEQDSKNGKESPLNIYEVHLGSWMRKEPAFDENGQEIIGSEFYTYKEIAKKLASYVKGMGYTHIELLPIMEHPLDESWGYQVTGYYSPTSRYGTPKDFMYFVNYMHNNNIGIILDWVPAHFPKDLHGLACFDGSCVYEHEDPRQGQHPHWGTLIYNYGRPQVSNFLIANALYWAEYYHIDGIRMDAVASMLYLDYGKNDGEWVANMYGGKENLEAIEFLKHLNSIVKQKYPSILLIAEESTAWPKISGDLNNGGLGFDFKWNMGWMNDFLNYMKYDPIYRSYHYGEITFSMIYQYSENFILVLSHDEVVHGKGSLAGKMPGATFEEKIANLRAAYGFLMTHPGKKLLFMGQELGQFNEWNEHNSIEWYLLDFKLHKQMQTYVKELNKLYLEHPALWEKDSNPFGFEWIDCASYEESILAFIRRSDDEELFIVCNFTPIEYKNFKFGMPYKAKFKEIFNSEKKKFGGSGSHNLPKSSKKGEFRDKEYTLELNVAPMSTVIFSINKD